MAAVGRRPAFSSGQWEVDLDRRELRAHGTVVPLGGRAFDVIEVLVRAAGALVTKNELMAAVWPGAVVEENTLQVHISALRKALGQHRNLLRTASGRGYRLVGTWAEGPENPPEPTPIAASRSPAAAPVYRGNIPVSGSDLIGRTTATQHIRDLLSAYRAVTITGPGGIGKTRLALEVARAALPSLHGDGWLVELVSLVDSGLVPSAVAAALGLELRGDVISADAVARAIGGRKLLLVLDNCEHVIDAAARLAETVLRICPQAVLLATSREALQIDGECAYRVAPLELPPQGSLDGLASSAVQLFVERAQALNFNLSHPEAAVPTIAAICRRLDGIPLAIELAAARAATLGLEQVLSRLDDRFALLTGGRRTALPRHQTLRATLDWSYELLSEAEQQLLRRLAIFAGGFTLEAAAVIMGGLGNPASAAVDGIVSLVAKSLLGLEGSGQVSRWRMLETTRAYALKKLNESGEAGDTARWHAEFFQQMLAPDAQATTLEAAVGRTPNDGREVDNVRAALDWAFSVDGDVAIGVALTIGAVPLWVALSLMGECRRRVEHALASLGRDVADGPRARMQLCAALGWSLMFAVGRAREIGAAWSTTLELAEKLGDTGYRLRALWGLWVDNLNHGEFRKATTLAEEFAMVVGESTDVVDQMMADRMLATSLHFLGDQNTARHHIERVLGRYEAAEHEPHTDRFQFDQRVTAHYFQARILWLQGFADRAMRIVEHNVEEAGSLGNALSLGSVLGQGACPIALFSGDMAAAERYGTMLLDHSERHALRLWHAWARAFNAVVMVKQGDIAGGLHSLRTDLTQAAETRFLPRYLLLIAELANTLGLAGEIALGLETVDEALARCEANEERWYGAELLRIRGELVLRGGAPGAAGVAEDHFLRALDWGNRQGALSWELRAGISLAQLQRDQGRVVEAHDGLSAIYDRFSEGFGTRDLQAAKQVLAELV